MRLTRPNPRRGGIMLFVGIGILIFVGLYLGSGGGGLTRRKIKSNQQFHPEAALWYYTRTMKSFQTNDAKFEDVFLTVTDADKKWFYDNYQNLNHDPAKLQTGIDPTQAEALARYSVMRHLGELGPMEGVEILDRTEDATEAHYQVKWTLTGSGGTQEFHGEVVVVLQGDKWKVRDFAGAKAKIESGA